ncbi:MAG: ribosome-binding factor A [Chloroflexi bacterium]|nr:MAG: ribosome-binding factor A [Chloroflexota bacterium]
MNNKEMSKIRQQRTAEQIRLIISDLLLRAMNDPRLQGVTVTDVTIDRELQYADIYVHSLGDDSREDEIMIALDKASGFFRYELSQRMTMRTTPQLHFHWDASLAHVDEVNRILNQLTIPKEEEE